MGGHVEWMIMISNMVVCERVGMKNGSIMISAGVCERVGMKHGSIMISIMGVYERVGMKNGSIMISIMLCFYFLFNFLYKPY